MKVLIAEFLISFDDAMSIMRKAKVKRRGCSHWSYDLEEFPEVNFRELTKMYKMFPSVVKKNKTLRTWKNYQKSKIEVCLLKVFRERPEAINTSM